LSSRSEFLPVFVVANRLGLSVGFLEQARRAGYGPPFVVIGGRALYHWPSLVAWSARRGLPLDKSEPAERNASETTV
jgi:hypothetical protein